ncbi:MAG TPA: FliH/SctL family protein [Longimicrobiales bacterium]|jgi:flagellar assembly protein FliH
MTSSFERPRVLAGWAAEEARPAAWELEDLQPARAEPVEAEPAAPVKTEEEWAREVEAAYARGFADGRAAGEAEGRRLEAARLVHGLRAVDGLLAALEAEESVWLAALEENLVALAVAIAGHVIGREVKGDPQAIADLARRAIAEFPLDQPLRIRLNPQDLATISAVASEGGGPVPIAPGRNVRWIADPSIEPGGCVVEGRERIVDGRVDRALERIFRRLRDG